METNVFEVSVGTTTRRGTFQPAFRKVVRTNLNQYGLSDLMEKKYAPMEVTVTAVSLIEDVIVESPTPAMRAPEPEPKKEVLYFMSFRRELTPAEKTERAGLVQAFNKARKDYEEFNNRVRVRLMGEFPFITSIEKFETGDWYAEGDYRLSNPLIILTEKAEEKE